MTQLDTAARPSAGGHRRGTPGAGLGTGLTVAGIAVGYAVAVVLIVVAYSQAKHSTGTGHFTVFWLAIAALLAATVLGGLRLPSRRWPLAALTLALGLVTYLPKLLMTPRGPAYFDEYAQLRHAQDILATGNVAVHNDLLPVIQYYPGLGVSTVGVHYLTGLDLWHAGQVVIVLAHCATLLLIQQLARRVGLSPRASFFAAVVYACNPGFLYFDSQYAYESLAIPLLLASALCCVNACRATTSRQNITWVVLGVLAATATVLTHHVTSSVMAGLCLLIAIFFPRSAGHKRVQYIGAWEIAIWSLLGALIWNVVISSKTRGYLLPSLTNGFKQLVERFTGANTPDTSTGSTTVTGPSADSHALFSGSGVPGYEPLFAYAVPVLVVLMSLLAVWTIWRSGNRRTEARLAAPFAVFTGFYLLSLPLSLTATGNQAAHRSWPFFFIGVAVFSVWIFGRPGLRRPARLAAIGRPTLLTGILAGVLTMSLAIGNVSAGANVAYRFPGPYRFGEDTRFTSAELNGVVSWAAAHLPHHADVITDRYTEQPLLVGSTLHVPTNSQSFAYAVYRYPSDPPPDLRAFLGANHFRYFILDTRILTEEPVQTLFQNYQGDVSVDVRALGSISDNSFITLLHSTDHYRVYKIDP